MPRRERKELDPILLGQPSPSLSKTKKMSMARMADQIERLDTEATRVDQKLKRLRGLTPQPEKKIGELAALLARLRVLRDNAREQLAAKVERKRRWDERHGSEA